MNKEQIIIDGVNIIGTIDEWARLVAHEWGTDEYSDAEIVKNYILDINKQLARKTQECEQKEKELKELKRQYKLSCLDCEYKNTKADVERYRKERDFWKHQAELGSETTDRLAKQLEEKEQECEELKEELNGSEKWRIKAESLNEKLDIKNTHYRKALEEIETATKINCEEICGRKFTDCKDTSCFSVNILNIISKVKGDNR